MRKLLESSYKKDDDRRSVGPLLVAELLGTFYSRRTRRPTLVGYIVLGCLVGFVFLRLYTEQIKSRQDDDDHSDILMNPKFRVADPQQWRPVLPELDPQEEEFKEVAERNAKGEGPLELPIFNPNVHKVPDEVIKARERDIFGQPHPKNYPVKVLQQPDEELCTGEIFMLIVIDSQVKNILARRAIRTNWGVQPEPDNSKYKGLKWASLFVSGTPHPDHEVDITNEAETHMDMLQGDFMDSPHEGTRKMMLAMDWISKVLSVSCKPKYILKTQDNIYHNMPAVLSWASKLKTTEGHYFGKLLRKDIPIRDPEDFNYIPEDDYGEKFFPDMIQGPEYLIPYSSFMKMYDAKQSVVPIALEDGYLGLVAKVAGVKPKNDEHFKMVKYSHNTPECMYMSMLFGYDANPQEQVRIRNRIERIASSGRCKNHIHQ